MNKSIIYFILLAFMTFMACDPIVDSESPGGAITAEQLDISATPVMVNGKKANKVILVNHSPVLSSWKTDVLTSVKSVDTLLLFSPGVNEIEFTGLNADGTTISKKLTIDVEDMVFPLPIEYFYLYGELNGGKEWIWDKEREIVYGTGGYGNNFGADWGGLKLGDKTDSKFVNPDEKMVFNMGQGAKYTKCKLDGTVLETGKFKLALVNQKPHSSGVLWNIGMFEVTGATILEGTKYWGGAANSFYLVSITEDKMVLAIPDNPDAPYGAWAGATFWHFQAKK